MSYSSGLISIGDTFYQKFDEAGTYPYYCMIHPWKLGQIMVGIDTVEYYENTLEEISCNEGYSCFEQCDSYGYCEIFVMGDTPSKYTYNNNDLNENIKLQNKIIFLKDENSKLQKDNFQLNTENKKIKNNNNFLDSKIKELNQKIDGMQNILMEQIKIIMDSLQELKNK